MGVVRREGWRGDRIGCSTGTAWLRWVFGGVGIYCAKLSVNPVP